jgi:nucleoside-diphosphate-sugar epimerase
LNILITGNLGYVGPSLVERLKESYPDAILTGLDTGFFAHCLTGVDILPDCKVHKQYFMDVRDISSEELEGIDVVIYLAAISNDPMGNQFELITNDINHKSCIEIAERAKAQGAKSFIFASSCSIYGFAEKEARSEISEVNPLTAYAKSKFYSEKNLEKLSDHNFTVTCLRFATACGMSDRLRLDLVLNDFVAGGFTSKEINILSDGTPWRPLINVRDMAVAMDWAVQRKSEIGGNFLVINAGSNNWNYQVKDLAEAVKIELGDVVVKINPNAQPDKRSYNVNFDLFEKLAPAYQPQCTLHSTIQGLIEGLGRMNFSDTNYRDSSLIRLNILQKHIQNGVLDQSLNRL